MKNEQIVRQKSWLLKFLRALVYLAVIPASYIAFFSVMGFDAPSSAQNINVWISVVLAWIAPILMIVSGLSSSKLEAVNRRLLAHVILMLPLIPYIGIVIDFRLLH